ncbi:hypothetical protein SEA_PHRAPPUCCINO_64 [Mycobacterium phage Phrappuccino]|uniref:Uncharacterized protein n=1 Tax=Mycobacterium phage Phrappuccino TaxID=2591223 RepID=A0A514DDP6_9CAUD|nr:hypothetical protein KHQ87_gp064 [Mycobacterium phage Phrappuccino]QDH91739.1 hypothetical protein SEA_PHRAPPUCCINO_64 [Mycobacterium phage Phrappuccino]QIQ63182.1 hypothetical protein SEA_SETTECANDELA_64 [Mycobacterium phage Settecandela]
MLARLPPGNRRRDLQHPSKEKSDMTAVPEAVRLAYQTRHYNAGIPVKPDNSVFDALAYPPESGLEAQEAALAAAQEVGIIAPDPAALKGAVAHRDVIKQFYDSASILRPVADDNTDENG